MLTKPVSGDFQWIVNATNFKWMMYNRQIEERASERSSRIEEKEISILRVRVSSNI